MGSTGWSTGPHLHLGTSTQPWAGFFDPMTNIEIRSIKNEKNYYSDC